MNHYHTLLLAGPSALFPIAAFPHAPAPDCDRLILILEQ